MTDLAPPGTPPLPPRLALLLAAAQIAANNDRPPASPLRAMSKLLIAPRWTGPNQRAPGRRRWKRGEALELLGAVLARDWAWMVYRAVTPASIVEGAVRKFERRAKDGRIRKDG